MIIDHRHPKYMEQRRRAGSGKYNGAYHYSCEIVRNIIPKVRTDRNWITVNVKGEGCDHAVVFIHNNLHPEKYNWLSEFQDLILVCGVPETCKRVSHLGTSVYLPLSIDVEEVKSFMSEKSEEIAYAGRSPKRDGIEFPENTHIIEDMPRTTMLQLIAIYKKIYAVGRTAIEGKALGCEILPYDPRYPDTSLWQVMDNSEAAEILQRKLDEIDGKRQGNRQEVRT